MKVLDLGCGSGYLTFPMAKENPEANILGLDIVTKTLENNAAQAKKDFLYNLEFKSYDGFKFPCADESFDLIVTRYALHHFPDIEQSMKEIARVLTPGGKLFISDPRPNECDITKFVDDYMQLIVQSHLSWIQRKRSVEVAMLRGKEVCLGFLKEK